MNKIKNCLLFALMFMLIVGLDQASKFSALAFLPFQESVPIIDGFLNLTLIFNFGTSFGIFSPQTPEEGLLLICISLACVVFMLVLFFKQKRLYDRFAIMMVVAGAVSNLADRIIHGAVIDFIDVYYKTYHWPAFNIADAFICIGISLLILNLGSRSAK